MNENLGWKCPYCNKVYSPLVKECLCCVETDTTGSVATEVPMEVNDPVSAYFTEGYGVQPMNAI